DPVEGGGLAYGVVSREAERELAVAQPLVEAPEAVADHVHELPGRALHHLPLVPPRGDPQRLLESLARRRIVALAIEEIAAGERELGLDRAVARVLEAGGGVLDRTPGRIEVTGV